MDYQVEAQKTPGPARRNPLFSLLASLLTIAGFIGLFMPQLVEAFLPPEGAALLVDCAVILLVAGIGISVFQGYKRVGEARASAARRANRPAETAASGPPPDSADDPVARALDWTPLKGGGANFRTHTLVDDGRGRLVIRASWQTLAFGWLFILMGGGIGGAFAVQSVMQSKPLTETVFPVLIGLVFAGAGGLILHFMGSPRVFDLAGGRFWKGRAGGGGIRGPSRTVAGVTSLSDVHALQVLREYCRGDKSSYYSYELNLVLKDGSRVNVMDHGDPERLTGDAQRIARYLGVPVWSRLD